MAEPEDDAPLIERFQEGNESALEELIRRHKEGLFRFILRHVNQREEAADLLSETFVRAYQRRLQYRPKAQFPTWLYTIARNLCVDHLRWRKSHPQDSPQALNGDTDAGAQLKTELTPADEAITADELAEVQAAIAQLPDKLGSALILFALEGRTQLETAAILGCSEKAVETRVLRARLLLKRSLSRLREEKGAT